jgi:hypothetical protein
MPDNYYQVTPTPGMMDVSRGGREIVDRSSLITAAGEGVAQTAKIYGAEKAKEEAGNALSGFYGEVGSMQEGEAAYYQRRDALQMGLTGPDNELTTKYAYELAKLKNGESQGVLTPVQAALERNNALKKWTAAYPALGAEFRTIANEASGDLSRAQKEQYGEDPFTQQAKEDTKEALKRGITVDTLRYYNRIDDENARKKATLEQLAHDEGVTEKEVIINLNNYFASNAASIAAQVRDQLDKRITAAQAEGKAMSMEQIKGFLGFLENSVMVEARATVGRTQKDTGIALKKEVTSQIYDNYENVFKNMKDEILAAQTPEEALKAIRTRTELVVATGVEKYVQANKDSPHVILAGNPVALANMMDAEQSVQMQLSRLMDPKVGNAGPVEASAQLEALFRSKGDLASLAALDRINSGGSKRVILGGYDNITQGNPPGTGTVPEDMASKAVALTVHNSLPPDKREASTIQLARAFSLHDLRADPKLRSDIRRSREASMVVIDKATDRALPLLGTPGTPTEMQIDWSYPNHPFRYKQVDEGGDATGLMGTDPPKTPHRLRTEIVTPEMENIELLNQTYREMRDLLGYTGVKQWVDALEQFGVKDVTAGPEALTPTRNKPRPKASAAGSSVTKRTETSLLNISRELRSEVPEEVLLAIAEQESGMGTNTFNKDSGATGPLQVIPSTYKAVNEKYFKGGLDAKGDLAHSYAGVALLNELWVRYNGDLDKVLSDYHGGPDLNLDQTDATGKRNRDYVTEVKGRIRKRLYG